jgi:hypothetical protein
VATLTEQVADLADILGSLSVQLIGELPAAGMGLEWMSVHDDGGEVALWDLRKPLTTAGSRS